MAVLSTFWNLPGVQGIKAPVGGRRYSLLFDGKQFKWARRHFGSRCRVGQRTRLQGSHFQSRHALSTRLSKPLNTELTLIALFGGLDWGPICAMS